MSDQQKTIVIVASFAKSLINFRGDLISSWIEKGYRVVAAAPDASQEVIEQLTAKGAVYARYPLNRAGISPLKDLRTLWALRRLFKKYQPEHVLSYTIKPAIYGSLAAHMAGVKNIFSMITGLGYFFTGRGGLVKRQIKRIIQGLYRLALRKNKTVIFFNDDDRSCFIDLNLVQEAQAVIVNGSGVNTDYFALKPLPNQKVSFLLIARLLFDKGIREYHAAAKILKAKHPEVEFKLVGWVDTNPQAVSQADLDAWVAEGSIDYLGLLSDVRPAIEACSVYVLPSYREGLPRSVLEAMSVGRPIITTNAPGCRVTVEPGKNGYLVDPQNVEQLVDAMAQCINAPDKLAEMGQYSRRLVEEKFDVNVINQQLLKIMGIQ